MDPSGRPGMRANSIFKVLFGFRLEMPLCCYARHSFRIDISLGDCGCTGLLLVDIAEKRREGAKEQYGDDVLNALNVGIEI